MNYSNFNCKINVDHNPLDLNIDDYLSVALRNNKKRKFLFVSKSLGKHLAVEPKKVDELGFLLSKAFKAKQPLYKNEKQMVIGFAETATCLAHSFFNYLETAEYFIHTTREDVPGLKKLDFQEEHSHATEQNLYTQNLKDIEDANQVVLVDDEITTAKTCLNMITKLQEVFNIKKYVIVSILNWIDDKRNSEIQEAAEKLGCSIEFVYLFNGTFDFSMRGEEPEDKIIKMDNNVDSDIEINYIDLEFEKYYTEKKYVLYSGRFGIDRTMHKELLELVKKESKKLIPKYKDSNILCLGLEEFMYIPMMLSKEIEGNVYYHSTTRSPILPMSDTNYPINEKYSFESFYNENINYIYNLSANKYKECFIFMEIFKDESKVNDFIKILKSAGIKRVNIVRFFKE